MQILSTSGVPQTANKLYPYQQRAIETLFEKMVGSSGQLRLLFQLPTGGGKTVIFSEIASRFINKNAKTVIVLTHRLELCRQTSLALRNSGVKNKIIDSTVKRVSKKDGYQCYVAMVETLKHRIEDGLIDTADVGLVIVDEAHHNSFHKLLKKISAEVVIGVTATPFSADQSRPMKNFYSELVLGEPISSLIQDGFLAKPRRYSYEVELNTLNRGLHGDFTVSSSDELYSSKVMLDLLTKAYRDHSLGKKTLIFNNGIFTSLKVLEVFQQFGYPVRHLDNRTESAERAEILKWFKQTRGAILTSVSILTTGFDEPTVQSVILNRATTSLTLYHQMVGRGARRLAGKKTFNIIDLGNNAERFGEWDEPIDWQHVFENPDSYHQMLMKVSDDIHQLPAEMRAGFPNSTNISFDVLAAYQSALEKGEKPKTVLRDSIRQHALMCADNAETVTIALELTRQLDKEIDWRVKQYGKCLGSVTNNYLQWLRGDYRSRLHKLIEKVMLRRAAMRLAV